MANAGQSPHGEKAGDRSNGGGERPPRRRRTARAWAGPCCRQRLDPKAGVVESNKVLTGARTRHRTRSTSTTKP